MLSVHQRDFEPTDRSASSCACSRLISVRVRRISPVAGSSPSRHSKWSARAVAHGTASSSIVVPARRQSARMQTIRPRHFQHAAAIPGREVTRRRGTQTGPI
jgi:hypothetical protein